MLSSMKDCRVSDRPDFCRDCGCRLCRPSEPFPSRTAIRRWFSASTCQQQVLWVVQAQGHVCNTCHVARPQASMLVKCMHLALVGSVSAAQMRNSCPGSSGHTCRQTRYGSSMRAHTMLKIM